MASASPATDHSESIWSVESAAPEPLSKGPAVQEDIKQGHTLIIPNSWESVVLNTLQLLFSSPKAKIAQLPRNLCVVVTSR